MKNFQIKLAITAVLLVFFTFLNPAQAGVGEPPNYVASCNAYEAQWAKYIDKVRTKLFTQWTAPSDTSDYRLVIGFKADQQGRVTNPEVVHSSGQESLDNLALQSLLSSAPLPKFPRGVAEENKTFQFEFGSVHPNPQNKHINWQPYLQELQRRIRGNWHPPAEKYNMTVTASFRLRRDGSMYDLRISKSKAPYHAEQAALRAIIESAPFSFPEAFQGEQIPVQFTFDYELNHPR